MMQRGFFTHQEILSQPEAWAQALEVIQAARPDLEGLFQNRFDQVLFTGCGSTYYLSLAAAALFQELSGQIGRAVPGGELLLNPATVLTKDGVDQTLLVAISRSGATTETVRAVEHFKEQRRGPVMVITNYSDRPLAALADVALVIEKGQEESIAQTRSFASMYVAAAALAALACGEDSLLNAMTSLPEAGRKLIAKYETLAQAFGENLNYDRFYFLGSGTRYGLACEVNLKMKEMTLTHSEPFHFLEFRHGPMSMAAESSVVVGLLSVKNFIHEMAVVREMKARGSATLTLGEVDADVPFESNLPESVHGVLYLPILQLMAYYRSMAKNLNPDSPNNLTAVVKLDL